MASPLPARKTASSRLHWLALLIPLGYLPSYLFGSRPGALDTIAIVAATAAAWFLVAWSARQPMFTGVTGAPTRTPKKFGATLAWSIGLLAAAVLFTLIIGPAAAGRAEAFGRKEAWSVGIFQQALWWSGHGVPLGATYGTADGSLHSQFGIHFSPFFLAFEPIYRWRPEAVTLFGLQALFLGLAALPLFALARRKVGAGGAGVVALAWLLQPMVIGAPLTGFHDLSFAPFFIFTAFWAMSSERGFLYLAATLLLMSIREDLAIFVIAMGFAGMFLKAPGRYVMGSIVLGVAWLVVTTIGVMPGYRTGTLLAGPDVFLQQYLGSWGATPTAIVTNMLTHPVTFLATLTTHEALLYLLTMLRPTGFLLPLADPSWVAALPTAMLNMASEGANLKMPLGRYSLPVIAALIAAVPGAMAWWGRRLGAPAAPAVDTALLGRNMEERAAFLRAESRLGSHWKAAERDEFSLEVGRRGAPLAWLVVMAALLALTIMRIGTQFRSEVSPANAAQAGAVAAVPVDAGVLAPDWAYSKLANRALFASLGSLENRALDARLLARFDAVIVDMSPGSFEMTKYPTLVPALLMRMRGDRAFTELTTADGIST
ncbi:MAG TPA: DUF2079 domain-containing protein, partial [Candidatus Eisenbacteria bacterium]